MLIFDTSVVIEIERKNQRIISKIEELKKQEPSNPKISFMTYFELLYGISRKLKYNKEKAERFIELFEIIHTTDITVKKLVELKKKYVLPIPDLFIAAQVFENNGLLVTKDKDFESIGEIKKIILD
jgi:predicted nucleic acid-binding protein